MWFLLDVVLITYLTDCPAARRCPGDGRDDGDKLGLAGGGGGGGADDVEAAAAAKNEGGGFLSKLFGGGAPGKRSGGAGGSAGGGGGGGDSGSVDDGAPGEMGRPVYVPKEEQTLMREKFKLNQFNIMASDRIRLNRTLPDVRMEG